MASVSLFLRAQPVLRNLTRITSLTRTQTTAGTTVLLSQRHTHVTWIISSYLAAPEVYTVIPPQPLEKKPGQLEQWQVEQFFDKGFVLVPKFFTAQELQPVIEVRMVFLFQWKQLPDIKLLF